MGNGKSRTWMEIDLDSIAHNLRQIRRATSPQARLMAVVKANAYGHGIREVSRAMLETGVCDCFAVFMLDEALEMRELGITAPILVLGYTEPDRAGEIVEYGVTQTVSDRALPVSISKEAKAQSKTAKVHVKVDTGMGRTGFLPGDGAARDILEMGNMENLIVEGLYTHLATTDATDEDGLQFASGQLERFLAFSKRLAESGLRAPVLHAANSAAVLRFPRTHLNMTRPGIILYGLYPSRETEAQYAGSIGLRPAMSFKTTVVQVKTVPAGTPVGYDRTFTTQRETVIATLAAGYADGLSRRLSNRGQVLIGGQRAPILGIVCMDQCMADVTGIRSTVRVGDEAVIFGSQGGNEINIREVAEGLGQIRQELLCGVGRRVPRVYLRNSKVSAVQSYLR